MEVEYLVAAMGEGWSIDPWLSPNESRQLGFNSYRATLKAQDKAPRPPRRDWESNRGKTRERMRRLRAARRLSTPSPTIPPTECPSQHCDEPGQPSPSPPLERLQWNQASQTE